MRAVRVLVAVLVAAASSLLALAPVLASGAVPMTTVTIAIAHCNGCRVSLVPGDEFTYTGMPGRAKVVGGTVRFSVPTNETKGLELTVDDPKAVDIDAAAYAVFRYQGQHAGKHVSARRSAREKKGYVCSAGTTKPAVRWTFRVVHYPDTGMLGKKGYSDRIYGNPGVRKLGDLRPLHRGAFYMNGDNYCSDAARPR